MLTKEDKGWITEQLAKELNPVCDSVDLLRKKVPDINLDKLHSDTRLNAIEASQMRVEEKVDSFDKEMGSLEGKFDSLDKNVTELQVDSKLLQQAIFRLEQGQDEIRSLASQTLTVAQGLAGNIADLEQENRMGAITLRRHDIQIHELAHVTGTTISE